MEEKFVWGAAGKVKKKKTNSSDDIKKSSADFDGDKDYTKEFKVSDRELKKYVKELNKTVKPTQKAVEKRDSATRYQSIQNPNKDSGVSTFKISNKKYDAKATELQRDWGKKYLAANVYAEANGYTLKYDPKKRKHYLEKK